VSGSYSHGPATTLDHFDRSEPDQQHRAACSRFGKIVTKLRHAFWSSCHLTQISRCTILPPLTTFSKKASFGGD
jgi:hypothetical protein